MRVKPSGTSNTAFFIIPEDSDDLFTLRRLIEKGERVIADSTRLVKQVKEYGRPDKGETRQGACYHQSRAEQA